MFHSVLQAIEIGKPLLPTLVAGLHIDVTGTGQNPRLGAPVAGKLKGSGGTHGAVVVGADDLAREGQQVARKKCSGAVAAQWATVMQPRL